jgi:hypothetical protein
MVHSILVSKTVVKSELIWIAIKINQNTKIIGNKVSMYLDSVVELNKTKILLINFSRLGIRWEDVLEHHHYDNINKILCLGNVLQWK